MRYERRAVKEGRRFRVFTNSMSDFFEDHRDLDEARAQALEIILDTPHLDWLILTKRPQSIVYLLRRASKHPRLATRLSGWIDGILKPPPNIWLGTTVEDQQRADERIPALLQVPAAVRFLSCEPLLGPVDLNEIRIKVGTWEILWSVGLDWVICGGESGPKARPMHPDWARGLRDQCAAAGVPFLFKQWGEWAPNCLCGRENACPEMKRPEPGKPGCMFRCGKKAAGRLLDGQIHDAFPEVAP
jgi:protein gp37